jgi:hypothetical protein
MEQRPILAEDSAPPSRHQSRAPAHDAPDVAPDSESGGLLQAVLRFIEDVVGSTDGLIEIYSDRARQAVRRTFVRVAVGTGVALCAAIWLSAALLAILRGACAGFTALWGGREWLGELTGGTVAVLLAVGSGALYLRLSARRELRRLETKYERIRNEQDQRSNTAAPAQDGGGAA